MIEALAPRVERDVYARSLRIVPSRSVWKQAELSRLFRVGVRGPMAKKEPEDIEALTRELEALGNCPAQTPKPNGANGTASVNGQLAQHRRHSRSVSPNRCKPN